MVEIDHSWTDTLDVVRAALVRGEQGRAETALTGYSRAHPDDSNAVELHYWRALARLDLSRGAFPVRELMGDLDVYRAAGDSLPRAAETAVLRRVVGQLDSLRAALSYEKSALASAQGALVPRDSLRIRDEELARVKAELDRVRRRLAAPGTRP